MAVDDKSLYLDTTNQNDQKLINSGKVGMLVTGPWDLSLLSDVDYGVQVMPSYAGSSAGIRPSRDPTTGWSSTTETAQAGGHRFREMAVGAEQVKTFSLQTADLPIRISVGDDQTVLNELNENLPGTAVSSRT